ncbi:hypothetical protein HMPREF0762_00448 [Slackia exigua ATCC 700122]|uniref:Uncharacterized protein n=1 Tax=Slackia exigua (strain ATCC 700122 / DSM 15923 / CIP 105133 / JCM 11022 / KCTC 5966 / S-7) TaxID=649764 RepID=D0WFD0_SLAES|nr:hypothetical protein HMPREF0762_00448 [Slackia exigua ATCC 700122]
MLGSVREFILVKIVRKQITRRFLPCLTRDASASHPAELSRFRTARIIAIDVARRHGLKNVDINIKRIVAHDDTFLDDGCRLALIVFCRRWFPTICEFTSPLSSNGIGLIGILQPIKVGCQQAVVERNSGRSKLLNQLSKIMQHLWHRFSSYQSGEAARQLFFSSITIMILILLDQISHSEAKAMFSAGNMHRIALRLLMECIQR